MKNSIFQFISGIFKLSTWNVNWALGFTPFKPDSVAFFCIPRSESGLLIVETLRPWTAEGRWVRRKIPFTKGVFVWKSTKSWLFTFGEGIFAVETLSSDSELLGNDTVTGKALSTLGRVRLRTSFLGLFRWAISLGLILLEDIVGDGPLLGDADAERYDFKEGDLDGEGEKELDRERVPQFKRDICTFNWLIQRATYYM